MSGEYDFGELDRISDWMHAVEQWQAGDPRAVADFVRRHGVQSEDEREGIAWMLTMKRPDARAGLKPHTKAMLRDLDSMLRWRAELKRVHLPSIAAWVARLRRRLAATGMTDSEIDALLRRRRPGYLKPRPPTLDDIYTRIAERRGVEPESVKKLHQRYR